MIMGFWNKLKFNFRHLNLFLFKQPIIIDDNEVFLIIIYFQGTTVFHEVNI
jgi:hypothetical protein